jgi:glutamate racemase
MNDNRPIGVFDSGVGGLMFAKEIKRLLPNESLVYFGDTINLPYGEKSKEQITRFSLNITRFLRENNCKAIVIACNSATANSLKEIKDFVGKDIPVIDVISPIAEKVSFELREQIGVIATKTTVKSGAYKKSIRKRNKHINIIEVATPLLVPVIEEGFANSSISKAVLETYLFNKKLEGIDTIILGCTHYTFLEKEINQLLGGKVDIVNSPLIVVNQVIYQLTKANILASKEVDPIYNFYVSKITDNNTKVAKKFFGKEIELIEQQIEN